ncbi:MAG: sugar ABC transporter permease [Treponema sp.]|jgi:raffinose/stachyose/melibiose transport system permease protein|nr:sugar ABC transporter permease [Treponema sp.]
MKTAAISRLERRNLPWIYLFLLPTLVMFLVFYLWPILTVIYTSFTKWNGMTRPEWIGITNYTRLVRFQSFLMSLRNLGLWALIAAVLHTIFGVLVALAFFKGPPGWKFVRTVFMIPNVISGAAWAMIYRFLFNNDFGLLNNIIRVFNRDFSVNWFFESPAAFWAITFTWLFYAVVITLVVLSDLMAIPEDVHEAAIIDGASGFQIMTRIDLPLCRFSIGTSVIMGVTSRISMYEAIALTSRGGPGDDTMSLSLILVKQISDFNYGLANAAAMVMLILGAVFMLICNRLFRMNDPV